MINLLILNVFLTNTTHSVFLIFRAAGVLCTSCLAQRRREEIASLKIEYIVVTTELCY